MAKEAGHDAESNFLLPVDSEHKATVFFPWEVRGVHMRAFHASWFSFFTSFVSTFGPAALIPVIRDDIDLKKGDLANAGIAAVTGTIAARVVMGTVCDVVGPRFGHAVLMLSTGPAVFGMSLVNSVGGFIACRFLIGFSLATFVACQFWSSVMFNVKIVGIANATGGGWGNLGGGVTQLLLPLVYTGIKEHQEPFVAWRWAFFVPGSMHILVGLIVLFFTQDLPDGTYAQLHKSGQMSGANGSAAFKVAISNYRTWVFTLTYGYCFGVELTMNNIVVQYFFDQFDLALTTAGVLGALFGLMNLFARSIGGACSDISAKYYGMRGRLWAVFILQVIEGGLCIVMGLLQDTLAGTICIMICFSLFVQASEGATYGIVPFISKRALGIVSGFVGAGGNAGSAVTQAIFFKPDNLETYEGIRYMGFMIIGITLTIAVVWFPMWGGMFFPAKEGVTEEDYYMAEYSAEEIAAGLANASIKFAAESRSQRGDKRLKEEGQKEIALTDKKEES